MTPPPPIQVLAPAPTAEARVDQHLTDNYCAIITPRIARWLEDNVGMTADRRALLRWTDPEAYISLMALHLSALRSESGTKDAVPQPDRAQSPLWMSTGEAANLLNVTDRCVRNWCRTGRLQAQHIGARWLVDPTSVNHEHTTRT